MLERRNIVLTVIDALRPDHLGCYGYQRNTSPAIDRIAAEGVRFENTVSQSSWTKPAVASMLTGTYPEKHGVQEIIHVLPQQAYALPALLRNAGYVTACIQTNPFLSGESGFHLGFDYYLELFATTAGAPKPRSTAALKALSDWLTQSGQRPFFLYLHMLDTHNPYSAPKEFQRFGNGDMDGYDAEISFVDYHLGIMRELLISHGVYEKTVLVVTADHGEEFQEHGTRYHAKHLYQEVLKVPLIIAAPGMLPAGMSVPTQVRSIDIVPTLLDLVGLPPDEEHQGVSLIPLLAGASSAALPALSQIGSAGNAQGLDLISLSTGDFKLILDNRNLRRELYHLTADPAEQRDIIQQEPDTADELERQIRSLSGVASAEEKRAQRRKTESEKPRIVTFEDEIIRQLRALGYLD